MMIPGTLTMPMSSAECSATPTQRPSGQGRSLAKEQGISYWMMWSAQGLREISWIAGMQDCSITTVDIQRTLVPSVLREVLGLHCHWTVV